MSQIAPAPPGSPALVVVAAPGAANAPPPAPEAPKPFAGKYADETAFRNGINEARKLGGFEPLSEKVKLIGDDGLYSTREAAEKEYGRYVAVGTAKAPPVTPADAKPLQIGGEPLGDEADTSAILAKAGITREYIAQQWTENKGKLTDADYEKLKAADPLLSRNNVSLAQAKRVIDAYVRAEETSARLEQVEMARSQNEAAELVGGKDKLTALLAAAKTFVPVSDQPGFDAMLKNPATMKAAIQTLQTMHLAHVGAAGSKPLISGQPGGSALPIPKTQAEYDALEKKAWSNSPEREAAMAVINAMTAQDIKNLKK